jgi:hypothetical protein
MSPNTVDSLNKTKYSEDYDNDDISEHSDDEYDKDNDNDNDSEFHSNEKIPSQKNVLPNKYLKLFYFVVWIINKTTKDENVRNIYFNKLRVFSSIEEQVILFENFYTNEKTIAKSMRKFISEKSKEQKRTELAKTMAPKGRLQILKENYIEYFIKEFTEGRTNNFALSNI